MRAFILAVTGLALGITACSSGGTTVVDVEKKTPAPVASVSVTLPSSSLVVGQTQRGIATARDASGAVLSDRPITWQSSSASIASVSDAGMISGIAPGSVMLSAASEGVSGQAPMTVSPLPPVPVATVSVVLTASSLVVGQTAQGTATLKDASGNILSGRAATWQTSNAAVGTVSSTGAISAISAGSTTITATSEGISGTAALTVTAQPPVPVASVTVSPASSTLQIGGTAQLSAVTRDANNAVLTGRVISWSSSSTAVATVSATGLVTAVTAGSATITASSEGKSGTSAITVSAPAPVPVASVTVSPATSTLPVGGTAQLSAVTRDANNAVLTGRVISWSSGSQAVATVSASGLVTAVAAGSATITALSEGKSGTSAITVSAPAPVASVTVSPAAPTVQVGGSVQLTAVTRDANGTVLTGRAITWSSSLTTVATVSGSGLVNALVAGAATITAASGSASGTAAITVIASPGPTTVFTEDFESGSLSKWNESNSTTQAVISDPTNAHSGNKFMRMTYGINGGDGGWLNKYLAPGFSQLYVRYYARFSTNFIGGTKLVALRGGPLGQPGGALGRAGICPNGRDSYTADLVTQFASGDAYPMKMYAYWQDMWADSNGQCWGRYGPTPSTMPYFTPMPEMSKGVWHKIELTAKENSSATAADGVIRFWIDGVKYGEWTGIRFGDPAYVNFEVLTISGSGNTTQIQYIDIDDLVLTTDFPSQSQP
jgi:uncharacterized protein YjdB